MPKKVSRKFKLPKPPLEHLKRLTDDTGLLQHAKYIIPDRQNGYCTDDNARALIVTTKYYKKYPEPEVLRLLETYLSFLYHALKPDKTVYNFLNYNRKWETGESEHDALGRTIWAFGTVTAWPPDDGYIPVTKEFFYDTCNHISSLPAKSASYAILGLSEFLEKFPKDKQATEALTTAANILVKSFNKYTSQNWLWFEDILSYANAIIPAAMYAAAKILNNRTYLSIAERTCSFLLENTFNGRCFSFIGSNGWYPKGKKRAQFDQQPIEAADTVIMLANAYQATKNKKYLTLQKKTLGWFFGENDINAPLYDPKTKGCCDGLGQNGININQGAESMVSFLLALSYLI